ncbi:MAG TPA: outer membrane lipoprotein chaperone LolA [Casimicrobiaceae bacterium]|nr:outer membrane lipoprotein chaperone LolA [Casimicrobiaceae bacterium]
MALAIAFASAAAASGIDQLRAFVDGARTGKATFRQVVAGKSGRVPQASSGTFAFARPGKFRWSYDKPYAQLLVGDGDKLWIYDRDLNQVIIKKLDRALGATPASLLAGSNAFETNFVLIDGGNTDGIEFVEAEPKSADTGFDHIRIGFKENLPRTMELHDSFGQLTQLTFDTFERNPAIDPALFRFSPPPGADVIGN